MSSKAGRIDELPFKVVVGTLYGLSIVTATIRTTYRIRTQGRLLLDDFVLVFACVTLTAATGLLFVLIPTIYWDEETLRHPESNVIEIVGSEAEFSAQILRYWRQNSAYLSLTWATIFSVKICFLLFFLQLVNRMKKLMFIWKIVFVITMVVFCLCVCGNFIACPHFGHDDALRCASGTPLSISLAFSFTEIILDIVTDLLIIMIPVILLWKAKIRPSQKIFLGIFLCLSICMIITAIVRVSGLRLGNIMIDVQWEVFFQQVEASVSVITVSLTAFRSLLGLKARESREKKQRVWYSYQRIILLKKKGRKTSDSELRGDQLPSIPSATLTGMRTFIRGNRDSKADVTTSRDGMMEDEHVIKVTQKISSESETISKEDSTAAVNIV